MNVQQLKSAIAVAECQSFSLASDQVSYSISSVSKHISALEDELGVLLFNRSAKSKVTLTKECVELLPFFYRMVSAYEEMTQFIQTSYCASPCVLTIGSTSHLGSTGLEHICSVFSVKHPSIEIKWLIASEQELLRGICDCSIDLSIAGEISSDFIPVRREKVVAGHTLDSLMRDMNIEVYRYRDSEVIIALSKNHPAIHNGKVALADLKDTVFLFAGTKNDRENESIKHSDFVHACEIAGFTPCIREIETARPDFLMDMVSQGMMGAPLMGIPNTTYEGVTYCKLDRTYYKVTNFVYYRKNNRSPILRDFIGALKNGDSLF